MAGLADRRMIRIEPFDLGEFGEEEACKFLKKNGYQILDRNFRTRGGEIDIIARRGKTMIFVEVKARSSVEFAHPWEAVGFRKRQHLKTAARRYIREKALTGWEYRFDIISITIDDSLKPEIEWIQNAF